MPPELPQAGPRPPLQVEAAREFLVAAKARAVILVEGWSDQAALEALARRRGRDLAVEGIAVLPMGGITNLGKFARALGPDGLGLRLAGLCDAPEEAVVARELQRLGLGDASTRAGREALGFFVCEADLEDEMIRALGAAAVEAVIEAEGELPSFRRFQEQPAQRGRQVEAHMRRFLGTRARRKIRYGALLADALSLDRVPRSLDSVLDFQGGWP
ncbi:ATP-dependent endonuclease [Ramlibacter sp. XY19]|uniref:ATP-dependent endonuclease n=1 Tax=Ramlibacter paludis TaxID=2908000 RepID=UPI0023DBD19B|nr:ATP-dependent endonuclease [Ramlibacter paludis]MCG2594225.1 ATP-dependent endonuclease [Ramlibacter paludis]